MSDPPRRDAHKSPLPLQPLTYTSRIDNRRPAALTVFGILSIVIGAASVLCCLVLASQSVDDWHAVAWSRVPAGGMPATAPAGAITQGQIDHVIQQADAIIELSEPGAGRSLTPQQVTTLRSVLSSPTGRQLMAPETPEGSSVHLSFLGNGGVSIQFYNGSNLAMDAQGNIKVLSTPPPFVPFTTNTRAIAALLVAEIALLGLALLLLVAGILMLRGSPRARRLHLIYSTLQIPLAWVAGAFFAYVTFGMTNDRAAGAGVPSLFGYPSRISWNHAVTQAEQLAALGCVYPILLLIWLNTAAMRKYYEPSASSE